MITNLDSIVNIIGGNLHDHLLSTRIFTLIMNNIFILPPKIIKKMATV
jgi:hypothetical protein